MGVARSLDGQFENQTGFDGHLDNVPVGNSGIFTLFIAAALPDVFTQGSSFTATVTFVDSSTATGNVTLTRTAAVDLSIINLSTNPTPSASERQNVDYKVRIINNGTELATGIKLTHQFVNFEVYDSGGVSNNSGAFGTCTPDKLKVVCTTGNLGPGEDATIDIIVYFRKASDPNAGHASFTASSTQTDASVNDNSGQIAVTLEHCLDLPMMISPTPLRSSAIKEQLAETTSAEPARASQSLCGNSVTGIQNPNQAEPMHAGQFGDSSIWYKWIAPSDGPVDFFTTTSKFNTLLAV